MYSAKVIRCFGAAAILLAIALRKAWLSGGGGSFEFWVLLANRDEVRFELKKLVMIYLTKAWDRSNSPDLADAEIAHIPIIALTSFAMASDREQVLAAGVDGYMAKPVTLKELVSAIATHLQNVQR